MGGVLLNIPDVSCNMAGVPYHMASVLRNIADLSCNIADVSCYIWCYMISVHGTRWEIRKSGRETIAGGGVTWHSARGVKIKRLLSFSERIRPETWKQSNVTHESDQTRRAATGAATYQEAPSIVQGELHVSRTLFPAAVDRDAVRGVDDDGSDEHTCVDFTHVPQRLADWEAHGGVRHRTETVQRVEDRFCAKHKRICELYKFLFCERDALYQRIVDSLSSAASETRWVRHSSTLNVHFRIAKFTPQENSPCLSICSF